MTDRDVGEALLLDASVLVELVVSGAHRDHAARLLARVAAEPDLVLITAAHGLVEAASALRRLVRTGHLDPDDGVVAVTWLRGLDLVLDPTAPRLPRIWELRETMSAYDAAYAAAADDLGLPLISTDARLLSACGTSGIPSLHLRDAG